MEHSSFNKASDEELCQILSDCKVIINLAGATINRRWTEKAKWEIMHSRIDFTHRLVSVINQMPVKPLLFISTSAVGIYPSQGVHDEDSPVKGSGFLYEVCSRWEEEAKLISTNTRLVIMRLGLVLSNDGGVLPRIVLPFRFFAGAKTGTGKQGLSWIHIEDVAHAIEFMITNRELTGVVNLVSPQPTTHDELIKTLSEVLKRPAWLTVPDFILSLLYGEGKELAIDGQQVYPTRLLSADYVFNYSDLKLALQQLLKND